MQKKVGFGRVRVPRGSKVVPFCGLFLGSYKVTPNLKDEMTLKSRGPIPLYYESLYGR